MRAYHPLTVLEKRRETRDSLRLVLDVPTGLREQFRFSAGQHLPVRAEHGGRTLRRTYSICSPPGRWPLEIGIRVQPGGAFSTYVEEALAPGDTLDVMPPSGRFQLVPAPAAERSCLAFAAGSGITPILSIVGSLLENEPASHVALFYGNRRQGSAMFVDELYALKNRYPERLQLTFLFSREPQEFPIASGRLDAAKVRELWQAFCRHRMPDEAFVCGPDTMIDDVQTALVELGMDPAHVHAERFGAPRRTRADVPVSAEPAASGAQAMVTVVQDGHRRSFAMSATDANVVDAAAAHGIELPYSCKGGVCATCRCLVVEGAATMAVNYGLEPWEVEKGYILACQSVPQSPELVLDYDSP
ncbi:MAG TPA: 2Fe-2S iron-sulfur cluster-binding protein [Woeseiaceae bacterium]|nr:2Fe-2S iron-sulfur cluster-binding protein [Woeseiaceae bacterium]